MAKGERTAAVVARIKEPSTWAGLSALLMLFGMNVEAAQMVASAASAVAGVVAMVVSEKKG